MIYREVFGWYMTTFVRVQGPEETTQDTATTSNLYNYIGPLFDMVLL